MKSSRAVPFDAIVRGRGFLDELQEGIWIADENDRVVAVNRALVRLLGADSGEAMVGQKLREILSPADVARLREGATDSSMQVLTDARLVGRNGRPVSATVVVGRRVVDGVCWLVGSVVEKQSQGYSGFDDWTARQVMENSIDGICIIEDSQVVYVNRRLEELTGYSSPQLGRLSLDRLVRPRDRKSIAQIIAEPHRLLVPVHHEVVLVNRSGREVDCELRIVPAEVDSRTVLICYLRDISQVKQVERVRADFIAMISHDLRTPLATIRESIALLADTAAAKLEDRQQRYLSIAREEIDRMNRMIDNMIEASRMEAGKVTLRLEAVDVGRLLNVALDTMALLITKKGLTVERYVPATVPQVLADTDRLLRVFSNLLDNAIKYSPAGGHIKVEVRPVSSRDPVLTQPGILANTPYVQVTVSDDGPGIPAEFLDRIFGRFERVDPHGPGIGLGLAIVRSIVELHHGRVWARSTLGEGTSLSLILPAKENA